MERWRNGLLEYYNVASPNTSSAERPWPSEAASEELRSSSRLRYWTGSCTKKRLTETDLRLLKEHAAEKCPDDYRILLIARALLALSADKTHLRLSHHPVSSPITAQDYSRKTATFA
jgi:hypothetical protein